MTTTTHLYRQGVYVSGASIIWTLVTSAISVTLGLTNESLVLIAFGCTGLFDAAGSTALVVHFKHAIKHDTFSDAHERIALLVVTIGLTAVALATLAGSIYRLVTSAESESSTLGLVVAACSAVVLAVLAVLKRRIGKAIPSPALQADGLLSTTGASLGVVTVIGTVLTGQGVLWADPVAAMVIAAGALVIVALIRRTP